MATKLHTILCINSSAPPRTSEKSIGYTIGINGGILEQGVAPPTYQRSFNAAILDTDLATKWNDILAAKSAGTVVDIEGWGIASKAVIIDFDWQMGPASTNGTDPVIIVTITALLSYAVP